MIWSGCFLKAKTDRMAINAKLKFSWGHIIALVALIAISYFSFLGLTYLSNERFISALSSKISSWIPSATYGDFIIPLAGVVVIDLVLALVFFGAQAMKATDEKFRKRIVIERLCIAVSPIVLFAIMYPAFHFWTVFEHRTRIEEQFHSTVSSFKEMFDDYESYADDRCERYGWIVMSGRGTKVNKQDRILALSLQLKDENYSNLKNEAIAWIDKAEGATVWNVFMIANMRTITSAIVDWHKQLVGFSAKRMSDEPANVNDFDSDSASLNLIMSNLDGIKEVYGIKEFLNIDAIIMLLLSYLFLMFPYIIQQRNTKSTYHLLYNENKRRRGQSMVIDDSQMNMANSDSEEGQIEDLNLEIKGSPTDDGNKNDFESFTM